MKSSRSSKLAGRIWFVLIALALVCLTPALWPGGWSHNPEEASQDSIRLARPLIKLYDVGAARNLYGCPLRIVLSAVVLLYLTPLLTLVLSFGSAQRALKRSGNGSYALARRLASVAEAARTLTLYSALVAAAQAMAWLLGMAIGSVSLATAALHEGLLFVATGSVAAACIPVWSFLDCFAPRRPWLGLALGFAVAVAFGMTRGLVHLRGSSPLADLFPGSLDGVVLGGHVRRTGIVTAVVAFWNIVLFLGAGFFRSDKTADGRIVESTQPTVHRGSVESRAP